MRILMKGMNGPDVRAWQGFLTDHDLYHGELSGVFEDLTDAGTRTFQGNSDLDADGIVGSHSQWAGCRISGHQ